jgi:hypothetical protein
MLVLEDYKTPLMPPVPDSLGEEAFLLDIFEK